MLAKWAVGRQRTFHRRQQGIAPRKNLPQLKTVHLIHADREQDFRSRVGIEHVACAIEQQNSRGKMFEPGEGVWDFIRHRFPVKQKPGQKAMRARYLSDESSFSS